VRRSGRTVHKQYLTSQDPKAGFFFFLFPGGGRETVRGACVRDSCPAHPRASRDQAISFRWVCATARDRGARGDPVAPRGGSRRICARWAGARLRSGGDTVAATFAVRCPMTRPSNHHHNHIAAVTITRRPLTHSRTLRTRTGNRTHATDVAHAGGTIGRSEPRTYRTAAPHRRVGGDESVCGGDEQAAQRR